MIKKLGAVALTAMLAAGAAACSSSNTTSTSSGNSSTTATTAKSSGGDSGGGSATTKAKSSTSVTKPDKVEKVDKSKLPSKAQNIKSADLTQDESDCIDYVVYTTVSNDATIADNDAQLAGVVGASMVACVPQDKIASAMVDLFKSAGLSLNDTQATCVKNFIATANSDGLAIVIGALLINEQTILAQADAELKQACNLS